MEEGSIDAAVSPTSRVPASIDPSSIPEDEGPKAGREAVNRLRGR